MTQSTASTAFDPPPIGLTAAQLDGHHARNLHGIRNWQGQDGVNRYTDLYPEAGRIYSKATITVSVPKPPGYIDAVSRIVGGWLTDDSAAQQTNRLDVAALNADFGGRQFNPDNHFSKPVGAKLRTRLSTLFEQRGFILPETANTLSKVKQAAKAARAGKLRSARAYGTIGNLSDDLLTIGGKSFRVEQHQGHACLRLTLDGHRSRLRLDDVTEFLRSTGLLEAAQGSPSSSLTYGYKRTGHEPEIGCQKEGEATSLQRTGNEPTGRLALREPASHVRADTDPLELSAADLEALRQLQSGNLQ